MSENQNPNKGSLRRLKLVGITYNQIESGVYAVVLQETDGDRRIPIIIGFPEAQAIECKLQEIETPRPLTHDLMADVMKGFGISMDLVEIYKLPNGVFGARLVLNQNGKQVVADSRSSDAIALAIRLNTPIVTSEEVLQEVGFVPDQTDPQRSRRPASSRRAQNKAARPTADDFASKSLDDLQAEMQRAAEEEDYERAARIKSEIDRRNSNV